MIFEQIKDPTYVQPEYDTVSHLFYLQVLNELARDLDLSKKKKKINYLILVARIWVFLF